MKIAIRLLNGLMLAVWIGGNLYLIAQHMRLI